MNKFRPKILNLVFWQKLKSNFRFKKLVIWIWCITHIHGALTNSLTPNKFRTLRHTAHGALDVKIIWGFLTLHIVFLHGIRIYYSYSLYSPYKSGTDPLGSFSLDSIKFSYQVFLALSCNYFSLLFLFPIVHISSFHNFFSTFPLMLSLPVYPSCFSYVHHWWWFLKASWVA